VVLDLATPAGVEAAMRLVQASDVLVENFRPGVMERLGLGYSACAAVAPRLVYCSVSGYGQTGPRSRLAALGPIINADCGFDMAQLSYQQDQSTPAATGMYVADILGGVSAFGAIMTALFSRHLTGQGQHIDVSLFDAMVSILVMDLQLAQHGHGEQGFSFRPMRTDDGFVTLSTMSPRNLSNALTVIGQPELQSDDRFATVAAREKYKEELHEIVETWTAQRSTIEVEDTFRAARVPCSRYRTIGEVLADPQTPASTFRTIHDGAGDYAAAGIPFTFSDTAAAMADVLDVPPLGDYTRQALTDIAGYSAEEAERISPMTAS
jgi:crotonobetainyl-CoA:carnitine CoA-transferase CaiB-like acyl-CoA transferase